ncbi:MAG TPA: phage Gp37/Gp68 family protein [Streptosporangiaceae bacterium]|nr:phage Gp37/Gp68 family protein [Streptosporangiaceae bacterium]
MSDQSKIEWTEATWSPTTGCDRISPGCDNCYALTLARRLKAMGSAKYQADGDPRTSGPGFALTLHEDALTLPLRWRKPRRIFVNSMSDIGHARVPAEFQARVWAVMAMASQHTFQVLTKRPERLRRILTDECRCGSGHVPGIHFRSAMDWAGTPHSPAYVPGVVGREVYHNRPWPPPNVWVGTSVELDAYRRRADDLRETPAALRFLSLEPLLGPLPLLNLEGIGWVIIGGESGPGARPMRLEWARGIVARCTDAGIPVFVKQLGSVLGRELGAGPKGGDWSAWPADLRVREFPATAERTAA